MLRAVLAPQGPFSFRWSHHYRFDMRPEAIVKGGSTPLAWAPGAKDLTPLLRAGNRGAVRGRRAEFGAWPGVLRGRLPAAVGRVFLGQDVLLAGSSGARERVDVATSYVLPFYFSLRVRGRAVPGRAPAGAIQAGGE